MATVTQPSEAEILDKVIGADETMNPHAAKAILDFRFDQPTTKRIRHLLQKNNQGSITAEERLTLERFLRVGKLIDLLHAKARLALENSRSKR
jgi:hypothetical protein